MTKGSITTQNMIHGHVRFSEVALCDVVQRRPLWHGEKEKATSAKESFLVASLSSKYKTFIVIIAGSLGVHVLACCVFLNRGDIR
jgi:hypothetical protein